MDLSEKRTILLILISLILSIFLFLGGGNIYPTRSFKYAWDLGHVLLFFVWAYLLIRSKKFGKISFIKQFLLVLVFTLITGVLLELLQGLVNRTSSADDLAMNFVGSLLAVSFFAPSRNSFHRSGLRILQFIVILIAILACWPFVRSLTDEYIAKKQFPLLSDFETPFEISRWICKTDCRIDHEVSISGNSSLKVLLTTAKYPGVSLKYFPYDWSRFGFLRFSIFNTSLEPLLINYRIHDLMHKNRRFSDRFNAQAALKHGWNNIEILLEDVVNAPEGRKMDLTNIRSLTIFGAELSKPEIIYIDNVRLE